MIWVGWREQRAELAIVAAVLALIAALLVPTGLQAASAFHRDGLSACVAASRSGSCGDAVQAFMARFDQTANVIAWLTLVPGVIGALLAAPFVLQLEHGTHRLDWTQSITRGRWIAHKLGLAVGSAVLAAVALSALETWWQDPFVQLSGRVEPRPFDSEGVVVVGYTLFALGLALAIGVVTRRAVAALVVAFAGYFAARLFVDTWLRERLVAPVASTWSANAAPPPAVAHAWVLREYPSDHAGHQILVGCLPPAAADRIGGVAHPCAGPLHAARFMHAVYEPASHFWSLQAFEAALFGGAALLLIGFAAAWTHARAA